MLVFALPLGVGISTSDDYIDVSLSEEMDASDVISRLMPMLPEGLSILDGWVVQKDGGSIMALVSAASYCLRAPGIADAVRKLFLMDEVIVEKKSKGQLRKLNIRPLLLEIIEDSPYQKDMCTVLVSAGSHENVRPDLLLLALTDYVGYPKADSINCMVERNGLFSGVFPELKHFKELN
jgi:radical SAM-linked protein